MKLGLDEENGMVKLEFRLTENNLTFGLLAMPVALGLLETGVRYTLGEKNIEFLYTPILPVVASVLTGGLSSIIDAAEGGTDFPTMRLSLLATGCTSFSAAAINITNYFRG